MKNNKELDKNIQDLPFRPCVGMMIINKHKQIFVGKRINSKTDGWQMPQGGIDLGETPSTAVFREMHEEIGSNKGSILAESKCWYSYRVPDFLIPKLWNGQYCGQKQKWFLINFTGEDSDININTEIPEFEDWKWVSLTDFLPNIIHFKLGLYKQIIHEFKSLL